MAKGWVKIHREITSHNLWLKETFTQGQAWVDLVLLANHKDGTINVHGNNILIKRGQVGWSEVRLSRRWKWSRNRVRRFLITLKNDGQITKKAIQHTEQDTAQEAIQDTAQEAIQQKNTLYTVITVINYDKYQGGDTAYGTGYDSKTIQDTDTKTDTNKKIRSKERKNTTPLPPTGGGDNRRKRRGPTYAEQQVLKIREIKKRAAIHNANLPKP